MAFQWCSWLEILHAPQTDLAVEASRSKQAKLRNREQVHDGLRVGVVVILLGRVIPFTHTILFQVFDIIGMDSGFKSSSIESSSFTSFTAPFN